MADLAPFAFGLVGNRPFDYGTLSGTVDLEGDFVHVVGELEILRGGFTTVETFEGETGEAVYWPFVGPLGVSYLTYALLPAVPYGADAGTDETDPYFATVTAGPSAGWVPGPGEEQALLTYVEGMRCWTALMLTYTRGDSAREVVFVGHKFEFDFRWRNAPALPGDLTDPDGGFPNPPSSGPTSTVRFP